MTIQADIQQEIRRYLLGTLPEQAGRRVEERLMTEEAFLDELTLAEGALIDDYVAERLDDAARARFEQHFLSTDERRRQLRFTRALRRYAFATLAPARVDVTPSAPTLGERLRAFWGGHSWALRTGLAFATVAVIVVAVWLARPPAPRTFIPLTLVAATGNRAEGDEPPRTRLPLGADALKLKLTLPTGTTPSAAYRARMMEGKGQEEAVEVSGHDKGSVTVVVPKARLARGRYVLKLFAVGDDGAERRVGDGYVFDVE
jgi:hypothetical protein